MVVSKSRSFLTIFLCLAFPEFSLTFLSYDLLSPTFPEFSVSLKVKG